MNMKKLFYFYCVLFVLISISSCVQDQMFENESEKQLELANYNYVCNSKNKCIPTVSISGIGRIANVHLSCVNHDNDHEFTFRCWGENGFIYKEENFLSANSSFTIGFPPSSTNKAYDVSYSLSCRSCYQCSTSGVIRINPDETIDAGSINDCFKDYLSYSVMLDYGYSNSVIIETQDYNHFHDEANYMDVNKIRVYITDTYGQKRLYPSPVSIELLSPYRLRIYDLPTSNNTLSMKSCQVELYNEKCKGNFEHYLYFTYTSHGDIRLGQYVLQNHKEH